jgi:uncharacterized protein (UPF0297 family)
MEDKTSIFDISIIKRKFINQTIKEVCASLKERGYNPINQIVGYLSSGDPGYISNYKDARQKILEFDRIEVMAIILEDYLDNNE